MVSAMLMAWCVFVLLAGCTSSGMKSIDSESVSQGAATDTEKSQKYLIGPGDQLKVFVWGDQELSTDVVVRPDGLITTPLVEGPAPACRCMTSWYRY